jgi:hypothetical protein
MPVRRIEDRGRVQFRNNAGRLARQRDALAQVVLTADSFASDGGPALAKLGVG